MWIKICGITNPRDAECVVAAGADAVGINLVSGSPRAVDEDLARVLVEQLAGRVSTVLVVADRSAVELGQLLQRVPADFLQLHGDEAPEVLQALQSRAFKVLRVGTPADLALADAYGGDRILVDARVPGVLGGTGVQVDPAWVEGLARRRPVVLAGGLTPENVAVAIDAVRPFGVDVASGVEIPGAPGQKDPDKVRLFVENARRAAAKG